MIGRAYRLSKEEVMVLRLDSQILEDGIGPESFHVVLDTVRFRIKSLEEDSVPNSRFGRV